MSLIQKIIIQESHDYDLKVMLDDGSCVNLDLKNRLGTVRFASLDDPDFFARADTDGKFIRWGNKVEISLSEVFLLAQTATK